MVDLRPDQLATVRAILQAEVPECEVWAFGSRAKWTARDSSDLDLALVASERLPLSKIGRLRESFKDSYLPVKVDVVDIHRVSDEFRKIIESQKVVLQKPSAAAAQTDRAKWQTLPLEECLETIIDYRGKTPTKVSNGIPLITAKVVKNGRIETPDEFIAEEDYEGWMRRGIPRAGDVLLTMEAPLGEVAQLDDRKVALAQRLVALRGKQGLLDNWYLKYLLQSDLVQDQLKSRATGTTVLGIKQSELRKINLALPPFDEQRAMAQVLGTLDDKIELNRRMNETLEAMARALFQSWFVNFDPVRAKLDSRLPEVDAATAGLFPDDFEDSTLGPIPQGWTSTNLGKEADFFTGFAFKSKMFSENPPGVRLARGDNVKEGSFYWDSKTRYWPEITSDIERYQLKTGDVLIGMDGSKVGKNWVRVRRCDLPCLLVQRVARLRARSSIGAHFIWLLVSDPRFQFHVEAVKTGTSIPHISGGQIKAYGFIRPPTGDDRIFHRFEQLVAPMCDQMDVNIEQSRTLTALRDALLPKLLSGELRVPAATKPVETKHA